MTAPSPADVAAQQQSKANGIRMNAAAQTIREQADALLKMDLDGIDAETAVRINNTLRMARLAIGAAEEFVAKHAAAVWDGKWAKVLTVEGVGTARPYRSASKTKWEHDALVKQVVDCYLTEHDGDLSDPYDLVRAVTAAAAFDYWRTGVLEQLGIDPDDYREQTRGNIRLRITTHDQIGATTHEDGAA